MTIIELTAPLMNHIVPSSLHLTSFLVWDHDYTEEEYTNLMTSIEESLLGNDMIKVDYVIHIVQRPMGETLSKPIIHSMQNEGMSLGPYNINLKSMGFHGICVGKLGKGLRRQIEAFVALEKTERDKLDRIVEPVYGRLVDSLEKA